MTKAQQFFYDNAGFSYNPCEETVTEGKLRVACNLAEAEEYAKAQGWTAEWHDDGDADPNDWDGIGPMGEQAFGCVLFNAKGEDIESLWAIWDPTPTYRRVVAAELTLEAMRRDFIKAMETEVRHGMDHVLALA